VDADFAEVTGLYPASLRVRTADGQRAQLSAQQHEAVMESIEAGLASLGIVSERCE
jgi:hypothetical protein